MTQFFKVFFTTILFATCFSTQAGPLIETIAATHLGGPVKPKYPAAFARRTSTPTHTSKGSLRKNQQSSGSRLRSSGKLQQHKR